MGTGEDRRPGPGLEVWPPGPTSHPIMPLDTVRRSMGWVDEHSFRMKYELDAEFHAAVALAVELVSAYRELQDRHIAAVAKIESLRRALEPGSLFS